MESGGRVAPKKYDYFGRKYIPLAHKSPRIHLPIVSFRREWLYRADTYIKGSFSSRQEFSHKSREIAEIFRHIGPRSGATRRAKLNRETFLAVRLATRTLISERKKLDAHRGTLMLPHRSRSEGHPFKYAITPLETFCKAYQTRSTGSYYARMYSSLLARPSRTGRPSREGISFSPGCGIH